MPVEILIETNQGNEIFQHKMKETKSEINIEVPKIKIFRSQTLSLGTSVLLL